MYAPRTGFFRIPHRVICSLQPMLHPWSFFRLIPKDNLPCIENMGVGGPPVFNDFLIFGKAGGTVSQSPADAPRGGVAGRHRVVRRYTAPVILGYWGILCGSTILFNHAGIRKKFNGGFFQSNGFSGKNHLKIQLMQAYRRILPQPFAYKDPGRAERGQEKGRRFFPAA